MSTDQPLQSEPHRECQPKQKKTSDRDRSFPGDVARLHRHQLVAIDEWLPGTESSSCKEGIPAFRPGGNPTTAELTTF